MVVCDTSVWINYFNGLISPATNRLDLLLAEDGLLMPDIVLLELLQGFRSNKDFQTANDLFAPLPKVSVLSPEKAVKAAELYRLLRKKGITIRKSNDILIASWCISNNIPLLHNDRDFDQIAMVMPLQILHHN